MFKKLHPENAAVNYLDDLAGAEKWDRADNAFADLGKVLNNSGILESKEKACGPSTKIIFLGVMFDTVNMTLTITPERLIEISLLLVFWLSKFEAEKKSSHETFPSIQN